MTVVHNAKVIDLLKSGKILIEKYYEPYNISIFWYNSNTGRINETIITRNKNKKIFITKNLLKRKNLHSMDFQEFNNFFFNYTDCKRILVDINSYMYPNTISKNPPYKEE